MSFQAPTSVNRLKFSREDRSSLDDTFALLAQRIPLGCCVISRIGGRGSRGLCLHAPRHHNQGDNGGGTLTERTREMTVTSMFANVRVLIIPENISTRRLEPRTEHGSCGNVCWGQSVNGLMSWALLEPDDDWFQDLFQWINFCINLRELTWRVWQSCLCSNETNCNFRQIFNYTIAPGMTTKKEAYIVVIHKPAKRLAIEFRGRNSSTKVEKPDATPMNVRTSSISSPNAAWHFSRAFVNTGTNALYPHSEHVPSKFECELSCLSRVGSECEIDDGADGFGFYDPSTVVTPCPIVHSR